MSDVSLNLVVIRSVDLERSAAFYGALGLTFIKHRHGDGPEHLACELGNAVFEVYPRRGESDQTTATRIGLRVPSADEAVERLKSLGAAIISPPKDSPWGRRAVVTDPDGHKVEISSANVTANVTSPAEAPGG